jgi:hypothetical protein
MTVLIEFCLASEVGDLREESTARADSIQSALVVRMPLIMDIPRARRAPLAAGRATA